MKQIEEGCQAVVVNSEIGNNGIILTVIKYLGEDLYQDNKFHKKWEIDKRLLGTDGSIDNTIGEHQLRRIDDEQTTTWEHVAETCYFIPNKETA